MSKTNLPAAAMQSFELIKIADHFAGAGKMADLGSGSQLGIREQLYNPGFKPLEFDRFRSQAGLNSFALSTAATGVRSDAVRRRMDSELKGVRNETF